MGWGGAHGLGGNVSDGERQMRLCSLAPQLTSCSAPPIPNALVCSLGVGDPPHRALELKLSPLLTGDTGTHMAGLF